MKLSIKKNVLLVNLGTPDAPTPKAVSHYLREFLMDPYVIDIPYLLRFLLVHFIIAPFRSKKSAAAYKTIWTEEGSPLNFHMRALTQKLGAKLGDAFDVTYAMRYGSPSIKNEIAKMHKRGAKEIYVIPMYPQYAESSYESSVIEVNRQCESLGLKAFFHPPFYIDSHFIKAQSELLRGFLDENYDRILFSYHGLPERHIAKLEPGCQICFEAPCASEAYQKRSLCYRAQCYATTNAIIQYLKLDPKKCFTSFQSRLGRTPWIRPYTDYVIKEWGKKNMDRIIVLCPSFTTDCLETIEEIGGRAREDFTHSGGRRLDLVPCVNSSPEFVEAIEKWVQGQAR